MAKKQARGPLSTPPGRNIAEGAPRDRGANARVRLGKEKFGRQNKYPGLNKDQKALLNQTEASDLALGDIGQAMIPGIQSAFESPYDSSQLPPTPWSQAEDIKGFQDKYYNEVYNDYATQAEPQFQKQLNDFDTQMAQRGIPIGSELYDRQKKNLLDTQEEQRQTMRTQALQGAGQYAGQWQDIANQNFQGAYDYSNAERYRPLNEYSMIQGAQSGMGPAMLAHSFDRSNQIWAKNNQPSGGGGGGGGSGYLWQQYGFSSPQEYDAYKQNQARENQMWDWQNNPQYRTPKQPNPYAQLGGSILGSIAGGLGQSLGKGIFG